MKLTEMVGSSEAVKMTQLSQKLTIGGETKAYPVYRIRLDVLRYNSRNDRIATRISEYAEEHDGALPDEGDVSKFNDLVEEYIVASNPEKLKATESSIRDNEQQVPGVVLEDGLVIDGNRRFTCLRRLARNNDKYNWFEASILPESVGGDREALKCLELALQFGREERVGYDPVDRLVGVYRDLIDPETRIETLTPEKYARSAGIPIARLNGYISRAKLMVDFLEFAGAPKRFSLARTLKIDGPLGEIENIFKKCDGEEQIERVKVHAFANILVEPEDITRFMRKMRRVVGEGNCDDFLDKEDDLAAEVVNRLENLGEVDAKTIRDEIRSDQKLKNEMLEAVDIAEYEARRSKVLDSPIQAIDEARKRLGGVDPEIVAHFSDDMKRQMRVSLRNLREAFDAIENMLDA
ncbi:hypothetical protein [Enorma phocaeensis]|uniref:hypothetical protein n=1 Tax=Enorma phocaeensis TaxID=1871019 RepID=UPI00320B68D3